MEMFVKKFVGKETYTFVVSGKSLHECLTEAKKISFYQISKCGLCGSDELYLTAYTTQEESYEYVKCICRECKASLTFGQPKKEPNTFYPRRDDNGKYVWKKFEGKETAATTPEPASDDLPF